MLNSNSIYELGVWRVNLVNEFQYCLYYLLWSDAWYISLPIDEI